ncbi:histidine-type phosphatase [Pantoea cypripedii]|uniref:Histidine-type phosphatase n=1 Tax=Pantoea cypripedii TaxID=55209 RepID=A0A6B9G1I4_PANCY|nr:histidine-type phosphatase [Pantoea cypripedii]QGY31224.1 histidine-type phosphatase [Pantoea cypripedii]
MRSSLLLVCALWLLIGSSQAADHYQLEKVVELSRHGVRPPTPGNRKEIEAATGRPWTNWVTADGELTGHGYAAVVNKGRWEGEHYRQLGLLPLGCPTGDDIYVRASPMQRTRATAQALVDGAFPGCGVAIHHVDGDSDPLFQAENLPFADLDPSREHAAMVAKAGDLAALQQQLQPAVQQLKQAVCAPGNDCASFDRPWQLKQTKKGHTYVQGLSVLASMVETLRLGWSENLPLSQLAWGNITTSQQITALLPILTASYDLSNDVPYLAQRRGSILLDAIIKGLEQGVSPAQHASPATRWLLLVAHDTNIARVRTLMNFSWQLPGYSRGNVPPGSSLVFERWRDTQTGQRFLRIYFQAQSLDDLRHLTPVDDRHPLLREEWHEKNCRITDVGTLCPYQSTLNTFSQALDKQAIIPVNYPQ